MTKGQTRLLFAQRLHKSGKHVTSRKFSIILLLILLTPLFSIQIKPASAQTLLVPQVYTTIKAAVNAAVSGDIILVSPDHTFYENDIVISDLITSLTITGANPTTTIIDGMGNGTIFSIDGTHVTISGFTLRNPGINNNVIASEKPGPSPSNDYHVFQNNIIEGGAYGISFSLSNQNKVYNNTFINNPIAAISLSTATSINMTGNTIKDSIHGIKLYNSGTNIIAANEITQTTYAIHITGTTSTGNAIRDNILAGRTSGIYVNSDTTTIERNEIINGSAGIYIQGRSATINYNTIRNSSYGIRLYYASATSTSHNIRNNKITNCAYGIEFTYSYSGTFKANWFQQNTYGMYLSFSASNTLYQNNFVDNTYPAYSYAGTNTWSSGGQGNYWDDYQGADANGNGIGDTPYSIPLGASDGYPLMDTWSEHDISVESVTTSTSQLYAGQSLNINVTVKNKARITASETFTVDARYNSSTIGTQQVISLAQGATRDLTFTWNTTGVLPANYTISAQAAIVAYELNTNNNIRTGNTVRIRIFLTTDINHDNKVDTGDLNILHIAYGTTTQSPDYNPDADLNHDGIIDAKDLQLLAKDFGKTG